MSDSKNNISKIGGAVIFQYARAQAMADGVLIDVTKVALEASVFGILFIRSRKPSLQSQSGTANYLVGEPPLLCR